MKQFPNQKVLAIVIAIPEEFAAVIETIESTIGKTKQIEKSGRTFFCSGNVCAVMSGSGMVGAASATEAMFWFVAEQGGEVAEILNAGVVGSLRDDITIGQPLLVERAVHYDFDISAFGNPVGQYPDGETFFAANTAVRKILDEQIKLVTLASGDKFIADSTFVTNLVDQFDAHICDMEGAAIARVAATRQIPVTMIKVVSDGGDSTEFDENLGRTAENLKRMLGQILTEWK